MVQKQLEDLTAGLANLDNQISDIHLEQIATSLLGEWRSLPPHLELSEIVVGDIERNYSDEPGRRRSFLQLWRQRHGSRATYRKLIHALLTIECRQDAESVCRLLLRGSTSSLPSALGE